MPKHKLMKEHLHQLDEMKGEHGEKLLQSDIWLSESLIYVLSDMWCQRHYID